MRTGFRRPSWVFLIVALSLCLPAHSDVAEWREAVPGYRYQFPRDHFEHEDFRTEWWYYTGNVRDTAGKRYGFELVFFRQGADDHPKTGAAKSAWDVKNLYLAHAALTDPAGRHFWFDERLNRQGPGIAGASAAASKIWNGNWSVNWTGETQTLDAIADNFRFHLRLEPQKPFIIEGENGLSQKAEGRGRASYYLSFPLLKATGTINASSVTGQAWMDHEWFTEQLDPAQTGWDWFSIQLDNHTELMLFQLRHKDGSIDPSLHLDLTCKAALDNQELRSKAGGPSYWEGAVDYAGSQTGVGYLEMTGYDKPVDMGSQTR